MSKFAFEVLRFTVQQISVHKILTNKKTLNNFLYHLMKLFLILNLIIIITIIFSQLRRTFPKCIKIHFLQKSTPFPNTYYELKY